MLGRLGSYEVEAVVGRGGMGIVLQAQDLALNRRVAIKVLAGHLAASAAARKRFAREAQAAAAVVHDHVIPIHHVDTAGPTPFLVMPFVTGRSLQDRLDACGVLETKEVLRIAMQTAQGLAAAHAQGLVHRDIKPANILLEDSACRVRITDFGLARAVDDASQTQSGFIAGTPQYMAPEQARGEPIDARADLFSLGSVMYAMCAGRPPFRAETTLAVLRRICDDRPRNVREVNPDAPLWLAAIIDRLLAKSPADRFQTADELAALLERWLAHLQQPTVIAAPPIVALRGAKRQRSAGKERLAVALVAAALLLVAAAVIAWQSGLANGTRQQLGAAGGHLASEPDQKDDASRLPAATQSGLRSPVRTAEKAFDVEVAQAWSETEYLQSQLPTPSDSEAPLWQAIDELHQRLGFLEQELESLSRPPKPPPIVTPLSD
jgi:serine/threonine-protein kinase